MKYSITIEPVSDPKGKYLHVRASGQLNYDVALDAWRKIVSACHEQQIYMVLGEQYMDNPLTTMEAWDHQKIFTEVGITHKFRIAWVDLNAATHQTTKFVETVLLNRGLVNGKLFNNVEAARRWLLSVDSVHDENPKEAQQFADTNTDES